MVKLGGIGENKSVLATRIQVRKFFVFVMALHDTAITMSASRFKRLTNEKKNSVEQTDVVADSRLLCHSAAEDGLRRIATSLVWYEKARRKNNTHERRVRHQSDM